MREINTVVVVRGGETAGGRGITTLGDIALADGPRRELGSAKPALVQPGRPAFIRRIALVLAIVLVSALAVGLVISFIQAICFMISEKTKVSSNWPKAERSFAMRSPLAPNISANNPESRK